MKKFVLLLLTGFLAQACGPDQKPGSQAPPQAPAASIGPAFRLSAMAPATGGNFSTNWCYGDFTESVVINAEKEKINRRYFYLGAGVTKVNVSAANMVAAFLLRPAENGVTEVYTGAHFPECLSLPGNFNVTDGSPSIRYLNAQGLQFLIEIREEAGHPLVTIEMPADANYGMNVTHCKNCP